MSELKAPPRVRAQELRTRYSDTGLRHSSGYITQEPLHELRGAEGMRVFRRMSLDDPTVGAILFAFRNLLAGVEWTVQAADDAPDAIEAKEWLESMIAEMRRPIRDVVQGLSSMFIYGWAAGEMQYERRDGQWRVTDVTPIGQHSLAQWIYDADQLTVVGLKQQRNNGPIVEVPMWKLVHVTTTAEIDNPEGQSVLRQAYRPWFFCRRLEELEMIGVERDLAGLPVMRLPSAVLDNAAGDPAAAAVVDAYKALVTSIRRDQQEGILLPSDTDEKGNRYYDLTLLGAGGARTIDTNAIVQRHQRAIATSVLADFILLGQQSVGSFALAESKTELFAAAVGTFKALIEDAFNVQMVRPLWRLNAMPDETRPRLVAGDLERTDLGTLAAALATLAGAGMELFPDRDLENWVRRQGGMPQAPERAEGEEDEA